MEEQGRRTCLLEKGTGAAALRLHISSAARVVCSSATVQDLKGGIGACAGLPKTRSGKIMRRILRKIAVKKDDELGDTSTLADPGIVQGIIDLRGK